MITCVLLLVSQAALAAVLHVPADYPTIGAATAVAVSGDEVLVAPGTYNERFALGPAQDGVKIHSESGPSVTIIDGGFTGSVVSMTLVGPSTELIGFTITRGGHSPALLSDNGGAIQLDRSSPKIDDDIVTRNVSWRGAVYLNQGSPSITSCVIDGNSSRVGGGIYIATGSPVIRGNTITNNASDSGGGMSAGNTTMLVIENNLFRSNQCNGGQGGGMFIGSSQGVIAGNHFVSNSAGIGGGLCASSITMQISDNVFQVNTANIGGGLALDSSNPVVENNTFLSNSGATAAGGIYVSSPSNPIIRGNLIQDNDCPHGSGGGIYLDQGASATIEKNLILRNHCVAFGGGVTIWAQSTPTLTGNTIALNRGDLGGGNVYVRGSSSLNLQGNILSHSPQQGLEQDDVEGPSTVTLSCNDVSNNAGGNYTGLPDPTGSDGNISSDPLFCDLMALDVHLSSVSPCATANSPAGCGLIGARDVNCEGPVRTQTTTWGGLKAAYR